MKKGTKKPRKLAKPDRFPPIDEELRKRTKADSIAMIQEIAKELAVAARGSEDRLNVEKLVDLLVADVSSAIDRATDFDERMTNHNFDVDWQAYADVQKGLSLLVTLGQLAEAKSHTLKLMKNGSDQVECSNEGLTADDVCRPLKPLIQAVKAAGAIEAAKQAGDMQQADQVGSFCDKELTELGAACERISIRGLSSG